MLFRLLTVIGYILLCVVVTILLGFGLKFWINFLDKKGELLSTRMLPKIRHTLLTFKIIEILAILFIPSLAIILIFFILNRNSIVWQLIIIFGILLFMSYVIYINVLYGELKKIYIQHSIIDKIVNKFKTLGKNIILKYIYLCFKQLLSIDTQIATIIIILGMSIAQIWGLGVFEFYISVIVLIPVAFNLWVYLTFKPATKSESWINNKKDCNKRRAIIFLLFVFISVYVNYNQFSNFIYNNSKISIGLYIANLMIVLFLVFDRLLKIWYDDYQEYLSKHPSDKANNTV